MVLVLSIARFILIGIIMMLAASPAMSETAPALHTMKPLDRTSPNTLITRADGEEQPFSELVGRPMLINFWASWCAPCVRELPDLMVLNEALEQDGMGVMLIGIDSKGHAFGEAFLAQKGITIPTRIYAPDLAQIFAVNVMPSSFLMTADGQIIGKIEGPLNWPAPRIIAGVKSALSP